MEAVACFVARFDWARSFLAEPIALGRGNWGRGWGGLPSAPGRAAAASSFCVCDAHTQSLRTTTYGPPHHALSPPPSLQTTAQARLLHSTSSEMLTDRTDCIDDSALDCWTGQSRLRRYQMRNEMTFEIVHWRKTGTP